MVLKNIIIFSEENDHTTSSVINWLTYFGNIVYRINSDDFLLKIKSIQAGQIKLQTSFSEITIAVNDIVWFRRISIYHTFYFDKSEDEFQLAFKKFRTNENITVYHSLINWIVLNCKCIGNPFKSNLNKIEQIIIAQKIGLKCPDWLITSNRKDLELFFNKHEAVAKKDFGHFSWIKGDTGYKNLTQLLDLENLDEFEIEFSPTFFQEYIKKKYEIRIFQWKEKFYSMAIFSQNDHGTKIDFRNYNKELPNRNVPIKMPQEYLDSLYRFSKEVKVDHGSYDILVNDKDEFYFLELNPVGQLEMVSGPCNYNIERDIAKSLMEINFS